jgi:hypothetical protein
MIVWEDMTPEQKADAVRAVLAEQPDLSTTQIAEQIGVRKSQVNGVIGREKISLARRPGFYWELVAAGVARKKAMKPRIRIPWNASIVPVADRSHRQCCFTLPHIRPRHVCGAPTIGISPWCPSHARRLSSAGDAA